MLGEGRRSILNFGYFQIIFVLNFHQNLIEKYWIHCFHCNSHLRTPTNCQLANNSSLPHLIQKSYRNPIKKASIKPPSQGWLRKTVAPKNIHLVNKPHQRDSHFSSSTCSNIYLTWGRQIKRNMLLAINFIIRKNMKNCIAKEERNKLDFLFVISRVETVYKLESEVVFLVMWLDSWLSSVQKQIEEPN